MTGLDWNGNGKYDPVDVGIDIATQETEQEEGKRKPKRNDGCLAAVLMMPFTISVALVKMFVGGGFNG